MPAHYDAYQHRNRSGCHPPPAPPEGTSDRLRLWGRSDRSVHRRQQTITPARYGLDESWILGGVAQGVTQAADGGIQTVIEINVRICRPEAPAEFFPGYYFTGMFQQNREDLKGLLLKADADTVATQLASLHIHFKNTELDALVPVRRRLHNSTRTRV
jgi:hypothetical protein